MKKLGKFLMVGALVATVAAGTVGFAACGNSGADYEGEYKYSQTFGTNTSYYGVKVTVTISDIKETKKGTNPFTNKEVSAKAIVDGKITKVTVSDPEGFHNITETWKEGAHEGDLGHDKTAAAINDYLKTFKGKKVSEIAKLTVPGAPNAPSVDDASKEQWKDYVLTGATQTSGRIVLAVQDAIEEWEKHEYEYNFEQSLKAMGMTKEEYEEAMKGLRG